MDPLNNRCGVMPRADSLRNPLHHSLVSSMELDLCSAKAIDLANPLRGPTQDRQVHVVGFGQQGRPLCESMLGGFSYGRRKWACRPSCVGMADVPESHEYSGESGCNAVSIFNVTRGSRQRHCVYGCRISIHQCRKRVELRVYVRRRGERRHSAEN